MQSSKQNLSIAKKNIKNILALFNIKQVIPDIWGCSQKSSNVWKRIKNLLTLWVANSKNMIVCEPKNRFKITIFILSLDNIIHECKSRFNDKFNHIIALEV